jgi:tetratricopeptide (TPR) repeat protein
MKPLHSTFTLHSTFIGEAFVKEASGITRYPARAICGLVFFVLFSCPALAQQITGQVHYADSGQAAFNVPVRCVGTAVNTQIVTDRSGRFVCRVAPGHYDVTVEAPGYLREQQSVDILDSFATEFMTFRLRPDLSAAARKPPVVTVPADRNAPPEANTEFQKAEAALAEGKLEEEVRHLEKAVAVYPKFIQAELKLGAAYMDLQQWDKAERALLKTLEIDPKAVNAFFALGEVYRSQKRYDQAEKALQDGFAIEARSATAHLTLARVYWDRVAGVKDEAQWRPPLEKSYQEVNQALQLDANLAGAHLLKGNLLFKVRRAADALHEYDEYLRLDPKGASADQTRALADKIRKALAETKKP